MTIFTKTFNCTVMSVAAMKLPSQLQPGEVMTYAITAAPVDNAVFSQGIIVPLVNVTEKELAAMEAKLPEGKRLQGSTITLTLSMA
jgi:hypothetical protein